MTSLAEFVDRLRLLCAANEWPELRDSEIETILGMAALPDDFGNNYHNVATVAAWTSSHAYAFDERIQESGRFWKCIVPGTSGPVEPTWPPVPLGVGIHSELRTFPGILTVVDGGVTWLDVGTLWSPNYDWLEARALAWEAKSAKASGSFDFSVDNQLFKRSQVSAMCAANAAAIRRRRKGSLKVVPGGAEGPQGAADAD